MPPKPTSLPLALRAKGCRVEAVYDGSVWRAGTVSRTFAKSFHLTLDKLDTGEKNPAKIKDKPGYWRPVFGRDCGGCKKRTVEYLALGDYLNEYKECDECNVDIAEEYCYHCKCGWDCCETCRTREPEEEAEPAKEAETAGEEEAEAPIPPAPAAKKLTGEEEAQAKAKADLDKRLALLNAPLLKIVSDRAKCVGDVNVIERTIGGNGWQFGGLLIDYRQTDLDSNKVIRGSRGWVFASCMDIGDRWYRRWQQAYFNDVKLPLNLAFYMGGAYMEGSTVLHGPFGFFTKYEKITGKTKKFYMLGDNAVKAVAKTTLRSREDGHLVGEIRGRWTTNYAPELKSLYDVIEQEPKPADGAPGATEKPTAVETAAEEAAAMPDTSAKDKAKSLIARMKIQTYEGKALTRQHERWLKDYPNLKLRLEAAEAHVSELKADLRKRPKVTQLNSTQLTFHLSTVCLTICPPRAQATAKKYNTRKRSIKEVEQELMEVYEHRKPCKPKFVLLAKMKEAVAAAKAHEPRRSKRMKVEGGVQRPPQQQQPQFQHTTQAAPQNMYVPRPQQPPMMQGFQQMMGMMHVMKNMKDMFGVPVPAAQRIVTTPVPSPPVKQISPPAPVQPVPQPQPQARVPQQQQFNMSQQFCAMPQQQRMMYTPQQSSMMIYPHRPF